MILSDFVFFDLNNTSTTSNVCYVANGNSLVVQVSQTGSDAINITLEGKVDIDSNTWATLACVDSASLATKNSIASTGIFIIPISGISHIRATNAGTAGAIKMYGKVIG